MNCTGKITNISRDWKTNRLNITFSLNEKVEGEIDKIKDCEKLSIRAVRFRKKRSLDANAYMWVLCQKIAEVMNVSSFAVYQKAIMDKGVSEPLKLSRKALNTLLAHQEDEKALFRGFREFSSETVDGMEYVKVLAYFGSSTYDTKQMSILIDSIVCEAKELDIETETPEEIERMKKEWGVDFNSTK